VNVEGRCFLIAVLALGLVLTALPSEAQQAKSAEFDYVLGDWTSWRGEGRQLVSGTATGTYRIRIKGVVQWAAEPQYPCEVGIWSGRKAQSVTLEAEPAFELVVEVLPGTHTLESRPAHDLFKELNSGAPVRGTQIYWAEYGPRLTVSASGRLTVSGAHELRHQLVLWQVSPIGDVTVSEERPLLEWMSVPGAEEYNVRWFEKDPATGRVVRSVQQNRTTATSMRFPEDVVPGRSYQWDVDAYGPDLGRGAVPLARGNDYFRAPDAPPDWREELDWEGPPQLPDAWLGVRLRDVRESHDGDDPTTVISVTHVEPGWPAAKAGLQPFDRISSVDGAVVGKAFEVTELLRSKSPGDSVKLGVIRGDEAVEVVAVLQALPDKGSAP